MKKKQIEENQFFEQPASDLIKNLTRLWDENIIEKIQEKWPLRENSVLFLKKISPKTPQLAEEIEEILFENFFVKYINEYTSRIRHLIFLSIYYPNQFVEFITILSQCVEYSAKKDIILEWSCNSDRIASDDEKVPIKIPQLGEKWIDQNLQFTEKDPYLQIFKNNSKGEIACKRCRSFDVTYTSAQTRSADEAESNFYTCHNPKCGYKWKT